LAGEEIPNRREITGQARLRGETWQEYERGVRDTGRERLPTTIETRRIDDPLPGEPSREERSAVQKLEILTENLKTLQADVEKAAWQRKHETYAQYRKYYEGEYVPAFGQYKKLAAQRREEWVSELGRTHPQLTSRELGTIQTNIAYIQRQPATEQAALMRRYIKQWEPVAGARLGQDIRGIAKSEIADPWSLKLIKSAEAFPKQYRGLPGPTEDVIAGAAKVGSLIVGAGEEVFYFFKGLVEPTTKKITKPGWEVTVPKHYPPVSPVSVFTVPEYRKWAPYAVIAAPIVYPLEFKAIGAGAKVLGKAAKTVIQTTFKGVHQFAPPAIKAEAMRHATMSRYLGIGEAKVRVVSGVTKLRPASYRAVFKGAVRTERVYFGEVIKPAPRWLMPKFYEKLMPSGVRATFAKYQHIRGAARPTWMSKIAYEAMPRHFLETRFITTPLSRQITMRGLEVGTKKAQWGVGVKRVEQMIMGGRQALRPETLATFKPTLVPHLIWFPAPQLPLMPLTSVGITTTVALAPRLMRGPRVGIRSIGQVMGRAAVSPGLVLAPLAATMPVVTAASAVSTQVKQAAMIEQVMGTMAAVSTAPALRTPYAPPIFSIFDEMKRRPRGRAPALGIGKLYRERAFDVRSIVDAVFKGLR